MIDTSPTFCCSFNELFIISYLWLISHPRSTLVLLDTVTSDTSREDTVRMLKSSAFASGLNSSKADAGKE